MLSACYYRLRKPRPRHYIDKRLGVEGFFQQLNQRAVNYVILRWFESLPQIAAGEDIDMLVADQDLDVVRQCSTGLKVNGIPCDLYSESGCKGSQFRKTAYFPMHVARQLLTNAVWHQQHYRVPAPRDHLLSMAFHAVYHKGYASGLPSVHGPSITAPDHDYGAHLENLAARCGETLPAPLTLEALDDWLAVNGWRPGRDTLEKWSAKNEWLQAAVFDAEQLPEIAHELAGLGVFFIRQQAVAHVADIEKVLFDEGFDVLVSRALTSAQQMEVMRAVRGGNWRRGPWPVDGGSPVHVIVVFDVCPYPPSARLLHKHPGLTNGRLYESKLRIRDMINSRHGKQGRFNALHAADNAAQALDYIDLALPDLRSEIEARARALQAAFNTPYPVIRPLSLGRSRRAKVELVDYHGTPAVCKTFRADRDRFLQREVAAREIGADLPAMTKLLETGPNYIVMEWIEDHKSRFIRRVPPLGCRLLPMVLLDTAMDIIRYFRSRGYEYIDFTPKNLLMDSAGKVYVIDFEFLQKAHEGCETLQGCFAWYCVPPEFDGDLPAGYLNKGCPYRRWRRTIGLPRWTTRWALPAFVRGIVRSVLSLYLVQRTLFNRRGICE